MKYLICFAMLFCVVCGCSEDAIDVKEYIANSEFLNADINLIRYRYSDEFNFSGEFFLACGTMSGGTKRVVRMLAKYENEVIQIQLPYDMISIVIDEVDIPFVHIDYECSGWTSWKSTCDLIVKENLSEFGSYTVYRDFQHFRSVFDARLQKKTAFINKYATFAVVHIREEDIAPGFNFEF